METDIFTKVELVTSIIKVLEQMRADGENTFKSINDAMLQLDMISQSTARRHCVALGLLEDCAVLSSTGHRSLASDARFKGILFAIT